MHVDRRKILVIGEEPQARLLLMRALREAGSHVGAVSSTREGLDIIAQSTPMAVVLDLASPTVSADAALAAVRGLYQGALLAVADSERDIARIDALDAGADDCVKRPIGERELLTRLKVAMHRSLARSDMPRLLQSGALVIDLVRWEIRIGQSVAPLSPAEFAVLGRLMKAGGAVVETACLKTAVQDQSTDAARLRAVIARLRRKLGPEVVSGIRIWTEPSLGYRLQLRA